MTVYNQNVVQKLINFTDRVIYSLHLFLLFLFACNLVAIIM